MCKIGKIDHIPQIISPTRKRKKMAKYLILSNIFVACMVVLCIVYCAFHVCLYKNIVAEPIYPRNLLIQCTIIHNRIVY